MFDVFLYTGLRRGDAAVRRQATRPQRRDHDRHRENRDARNDTDPARVAGDARCGPTGDLAFIGNATNGNPLTKESLGNLFAEACRTAGIWKSAHGLRKAAATNAANHSATVAELEAIFGWAGGHMAALYTRSANRRALSSNAMSKLSRTETETSIPAPSEKVRAPERKA
ncbi:tyrosine-type recombinase/integrase [Bradyrhizobium japonicum]|uniref:tyrosine-type recombinase/integrase n=1 Tax=Bradyrhizobium japonicum TaxID=375 RepID=UPI001FCC47B5|nr:tyrosine-type recombinase/integrase [Bradyrhizobium japonicum]